MRIANVIDSLFYFYEILIIVWCLISWIPRRSSSVIDDIASVLDRIVGPYLRVFQRIIPPVGGIDFSPIIAVLVLGLIKRLIVRVLV